MGRNQIPEIPNEKSITGTITVPMQYILWTLTIYGTSPIRIHIIEQMFGTGVIKEPKWIQSYP